MKRAVISLLLTGLAQCQVTTPEAPDLVVSDYAQKAKADLNRSSCEKACASIAETIPQAFFLRDEGDCKLWDRKQEDVIPSCRIEPSTPEHVSITIKVAAANWCHFAIRGGGHSRIVGSSNAEDGITIDLKKFNQVIVSKDKKTVEIGGGSTWGPVYKTLEKDNLMVVGGRVSDVGVGGLLLGGGISFLSNRHGWGADSITAFDVVLPDGSMKTITQKSDPDYYWALRGGGNNFGVVTAFHLELLKRSPNFWRGNVGYTFDKMDLLLEAQQNFVTKQQPNDPDAVAFFPYCYNQPYDLLMAFPSFFHASHSDNITWPKAFSAFEDIEPIPETSSFVVKPMSEMTDDIEQMSPYGMRQIYKTITYHSDPGVDKKILDVFIEQVEKIKSLESVSPCVVLHPTPLGHTKPMRKNGGNSLGIAGEGPLTIMMTSWSWKNKVDDTLNIEINKEIFDRATEIAANAGKLIPYIYQNYAWEDQDVFAGYGKENQAKLQKIQKRLDPDGIFAGGDGLSKGYFKVNTKVGNKANAAGSKDEL